MFIDRTAELANLAAHHRSGRAELFILYGRRRVAKAELVTHFPGAAPLLAGPTFAHPTL
jgi:AAA+ ATPase superfamily predicted ATPase